MIEKLVRRNIQKLKSYSSARDESKLPASVYLDANENALGSPVNQLFSRYPDPRHTALRQVIAGIRNVPAENIFLGNGSDEIIDLAIRIFCEPGIDNVITCVPTYGMYAVSAQINDVQVKQVLLKADFQLDVDEIFRNTDPHTKILFLCSPNNPTGNLLSPDDLSYIFEHFPGLVLLDEAYMDFADGATSVGNIGQYPNLLVMQTLSKAWGLAGLRIGMAFANPRLLDWFYKVKPPYNIGTQAQQLAIEALTASQAFAGNRKIILNERAALEGRLAGFSFVQEVFPSQANFLLIRVTDAHGLYQYLAERGIVIRHRSHDPMCENCLRITIGTPAENKYLLAELINYEKAVVY